MKDPRSRAVIDIGSNSIKLLVGAPGHPFATLLNTIRETRISAAMHGNPPQLQIPAMEAALDSIRDLIEQAQAFTREPPVLVATSAVRDAGNGHAFAEKVLRQTGYPLRILTGEEEARYVCRGALCDPTLFGISDFRLVDLGGGSLEVIHFSNRQVALAESLPLGAVRLTHRFLPDPEPPVRREIFDAIHHHVTQCLDRADIQLTTPSLNLIGSGGAFVIARNLISPRCPKIELEGLYHHRNLLSNMTLEERRRIPGLPPQRADIMVPALQVMISLAEAARQQAFLNTKFNLRYGILAELLEEVE